MDERDNRPSPDALLKDAARAGRGRLKIFLGAAPGVGKTYEMLTAAQARLDGTAQPALPDTDYYKSPAYRAAYQCVACHTKGTTTVGFPK